MGMCRSLCHFFNFVNMRFVVKVIFFSIKFYKKIYSRGKFVTEFCFFLLSLMFLWKNMFLFIENDFLFRLIKQESYRFLYCIFQSIYTLNTHSIKTLGRSFVKALITLLIKQLFHAKEWLVINICLRSAIGRNIR